MYFNCDVYTKVSRNCSHLESTFFFLFLSPFLWLYETSLILSYAFLFTACYLPYHHVFYWLCYHVLHLLSLERLIYNSLKKVANINCLPHSVKDWAKSRLKQLLRAGFPLSFCSGCKRGSSPLELQLLMGNGFITEASVRNTLWMSQNIISFSHMQVGENLRFWWDICCSLGILILAI